MQHYRDPYAEWEVQEANHGVIAVLHNSPVTHYQSLTREQADAMGRALLMCSHPGAMIQVVANVGVNGEGTHVQGTM